MASKVSSLPAVKGPDQTAKPTSPWVKMLAGMAGGAAEALSLQPLDVTKTRLQLDHSNRYRNLVHCGKTIYKEEGARALYKGLTPFVTHLVIKYAMRFGVFASVKAKFGVQKGEDRRKTALKDFTAGLVAGCTEAVLIVTPFEVVKTRLQKQEGFKNVRYTGPIHCARTMIKEEGMTSLWKGVVPTMFRQGSNQAFLFMSFFLINEHVFNKVEGDKKVQPMWQTFLTGLVAAAVGPMFNCPMDVVKTRLMAQETKANEKPKYNGFVHAIRTIAKEEGVRALWKGLVPRLMRLAPGQAITWTVVSRVTNMFEKADVAQFNGEENRI